MPKSTKTSSTSTAATKAAGGAKAASKRAAKTNGASGAATDRPDGQTVTDAGAKAVGAAAPDAPVAEAGGPTGAESAGASAAPAPDRKPAGASSRPAGGRTAGPKVVAKPKVRGPEDPFLISQRELLLSERGNYVTQAEELKAQADSLALEHEPGDVQFDEEGGEGGTSNVDRELDLLLSAQARGAVEEIDRALAKMDAGTYGRCEQCGQDIPEARLEALPHASLCVVCKAGGLSSRR